MAFSENLKKGASTAYYIPARAIVGGFGLLLGYPKDERQEKSTRNANPGLLGHVSRFVNAVAQNFVGFISAHQKAIAAAFWLAGIAALTVFLWPVALAAVATFTIGSLSIAGLVGAGVIAQSAMFAAVIATAVLASTAVVAGAKSVWSAISDRIRSGHDDVEEAEDHTEGCWSRFSGLFTRTQKCNVSKKHNSLDAERQLGSGLQEFGDGNRSSSLRIHQPARQVLTGRDDDQALSSLGNTGLDGK